MTSFGNSLEGVETKSIGLSFSLKYIVVSRKPTLIEFIDPLSTHRSTVYKLPTASNLILFDWLRKSKTANFFVVSTGGVQILLIDENNYSVKKSVTTSQPIVNAWFDGTRQYLAINFLDLPGELRIFDLNKTDEGLNFKYPVYTLSLWGDSVPGKVPVFNTNPYYERAKKTEESNSTTVVDFINLYNECYILHIDSERGDLALYEVGGVGSKKVKILAESRFRYNIVDNLLVIHYLFEQISSVIDVRKDSVVNPLFGAPRGVQFKLEEIVHDDLMNFCKYIDKEQIELYKKRTEEGNQPAQLTKDFCICCLTQMMSQQSTWMSILQSTLQGKRSWVWESTSARC
jgi:hypothetical protein